MRNFNMVLKKNDLETSGLFLALFCSTLFWRRMMSSLSMLLNNRSKRNNVLHEIIRLDEKSHLMRLKEKQSNPNLSLQCMPWNC